MKRTRLIAALVGVALIAASAGNASAYYHPGLGAWMSRDPGAGAAGVSAAPRIGTAGRAVGGGFIPRDQYRDGMSLYQYVRSDPILAVDPMGTDRWKVGGWHQDSIYPVYDEKCCPVKYRKCGFYAKGWGDGGLANYGTAAAAIFWQVEAVVLCEPVQEKPQGPPTVKSNCEADRYLHLLITSMEKEAGKYRIGHNCRTWASAVEDYGIATGKYTQWADYDIAMAKMYENWARYDDIVGEPERAKYNREQAKKYQDESTYNRKQGTEALEDEARRAYGSHAPFFASG